MSMDSKANLFGDVLTFLKTQQGAEEIALAALRKADEGYLDGEPMKAFNERVDLIARIERLLVEVQPSISKEKSSFSFRFAKMWNDLIGSPVMNTLRYTEAQGMMEEADAEIERLRTKYEQFVLAVAKNYRPRVQAQSLQGECPTGDYKRAEAIEPQGSRSESPALSPSEDS